MYSKILSLTCGGSPGLANIRVIMAADRPELLWLAFRMVQVVLRESPSARACISRVGKDINERVSNLPNLARLPQLHVQSRASTTGFRRVGVAAQRRRHRRFNRDTRHRDLP